MRRGLRQARTAAPFIAPWVIGVVAFQLYPIVMTAYFGLTDFDGLRFPPNWIGLDNYAEMVGRDSRFWDAVGNTAWWVLAYVPLSMSLALILALLLSTNVRGSSVYRTVLYLPSVIPAVGSTLLFLWLLNPAGGVVNATLGAVGLPQPGWFLSPEFSKPALLAQALWGVGTMMVIFLVALQQVPRHLYEAAQLDGASVLRRVWHISLPGIVPAIFFNGVLAVVEAFAFFSPPIIASSAPPALGGSYRESVGNPAGSTLTMSVYIYDTFFHHFRFGYAAALSTILAIVVVTIGAGLFLVGRRTAASGGS
jgi:multiple sugar transport system permease protein